MGLAHVLAAIVIAAPQVIDAGERAPIAVARVSRGGPAGEAFAARLAEVVTASSGFALTDLEAVRVQACAGAVACLARAAGGARYLLILSDLPRPGGEGAVVRAALFDVEQALAMRGDPDQIEARIARHAMLIAPDPITVASAADARAAAGVFAARRLAGALDWRPMGRVSLTAREGAVIRLDGRRVAIAGGGPITLEGVAPGARRVALDEDERAVEIVPGQTATMSAGAGAAPVVRAGVTWGGAGIAAAGAALVIYAVAASGGAREVCVGAAGAEACGPTFVSGPGGVLVAPLGYSLALGGGIWALGTTFTGDADEWPWLPVAAGVAAGALAYGLSAAVASR